jgi:tetratricopeptide (TPR) repeat protein
MPKNTERDTMDKQPEASTLHKQCSTLFFLGLYEQCLALLNQLIELDGSNSQYYADRADTRCKLGDYEGAIADYTRAIALKPDDIYPMMNGGCAFEKLHQFGEALALYERVIAVAPTEALAHYNRGCMLNRLGRIADALSSYTQAIQLFPVAEIDRAKAYLNRGNLLSRMGRHEEARTDYNQAEALGGESINIAWTVAWSRFGRQPIGMQDAEHLLAIAELLPGDLSCVYFLCHAVVALQRGDVPAALAHLERARSMEPSQWDAPFWVGMARAMQGEMDNARQAIKESLKLGLPPLLLTPLYWLETEQPAFFEAHARDLLMRFGPSE